MRHMMILAALVAVMAAGASAREKNTGIGIIVGEPTGISAKSWLTGTTAVDCAIAWSFSGREDALHLHGDYLVHNFDLIPVEKGQLPVYFGIGGRIKFMDDVNAAVRVPLGIDYLFADAPVDLFLEIVPMLELAPDTDFDMNGGVGARYFF